MRLLAGNLLAFFLVTGVVSAFGPSSFRNSHVRPASAYRRSCSSSALYVSTIHATTPTNDTGSSKTNRLSVREGIKAIRAFFRAATGLSLTAMYLSFVAVTSGVVRDTMTFILAIFPTWFRYFFQPLLVMYYVPLYMLRTWTSPKKRQERHDMYQSMMNDWNRGVQAADAARDAGYWPVQWSENGVSASFPPDMEDDEEQEDELKDYSI